MTCTYIDVYGCVGRVYTFGTCRKGSLGHGDTRPQKIPKVVEALLVSLFSKSEAFLLLLFVNFLFICFLFTCLFVCLFVCLLVNLLVCLLVG